MDTVWKISLIALVFAVISGLAVLILNPQPAVKIQITPGSDAVTGRFAVFGAIKTPGVYNFEKQIRVADAIELAGGAEENADLPYANVTKWVEDGDTILIPTKGLVQPTLTLAAGIEKINLNSANKNELMSLPGIGEKRAGDIIQLREKIGGFKSKEDLLQISGINERLLESIYDLLIVQ